MKQSARSAVGSVDMKESYPRSLCWCGGMLGPRACCGDSQGSGSIETVLKVEGKEVKGQKQVIGQPAMQGALTSFQLAKAALQKKRIWTRSWCFMPLRTIFMG